MDYWTVLVWLGSPPDRFLSLPGFKVWKPGFLSSMDFLLPNLYIVFRFIKSHYMKDALSYIENAKEILSKSSIEDGRYTNVKYVKSACGVAYLGVLKAIDEYLLRRGIPRKSLPKKVEECEKELRKYAAPREGKLLRSFSDIYHELHIAGYYRGDLRSVAVVKAALQTVEQFIKKLQLH